MDFKKVFKSGIIAEKIFSKFENYIEALERILAFMKKNV